MKIHHSDKCSETDDDCDAVRPGWLIVLPWSLCHIGGVNEVVKNLINCFRDGDIFTPHLLISTEEEPVDISKREMIGPERLSLWGPIDHRHRVRSLLSFFYQLPHRCWTLRRILNRDRIQVVNPHFPGLESLIFLVLKRLFLFSGKVIVSFHLGDVRSALATRGLERHLWKILLRGVDDIVVVSNQLGGDVLTLEPSAASKMTTIYNGVDFATFGNHKDDSDTRFENPVRSNTLVSVGAFVRRKGHDVLVRAMAKVVLKMPDVRLLIVGGDGPEFEPIQQLIATTALNKHVFLYKDVPHEQIPQYLKQAGLFVLASRGEGNPLAVIEAGAAGIPVIYTGKGGCTELIDDGVTGRLVTVDDEEDLADAIIELLQDQGKAREMAMRFQRFIKENLSWERTYQQYVRLAINAKG